MSLLVLLIASAAYISSAYCIEAGIMARSIDEIGSYYRSVGTVSVAGSNSVNGDVRKAATAVESSPYVSLADERRGIEAVLRDMTSVDVYGMYPPAIADILVTPDGNVHQYRHTDAFFYGTLTGIKTGSMQINGFEGLVSQPERPYIQLNIDTDKVVLGFPEHVIEGQAVSLRYFLEGAELDEYVRLNENNVSGEPVYPATPVDGMAIGERYFLRSAYCYQGFYAREGRRSIYPEIGDAGDPLDMVALNVVTNSEEGTRSLYGAGIWYVPVEPGEPVDLSAPVLEGLNDEFARLRHNQSAVQLRTTRDMGSLPYAQPKARSIALSDGRLLSRDDEANAAPVVVINKFFAEERGLHIGDKIVAYIPQTQYISGIRGVGNGKVPIDLALRSVPQEKYDHEIELEIVGIYYYTNWEPNTLNEIGVTYFHNIMYLPDSVLPDCYNVELIQYLSGSGVSVSADYLPEAWFSFAVDSRDEEAFMGEAGETLSSLGFGVSFISSDAAGFWDAAGRIMHSLVLKATAACLAAAFMFVIIAFLFSRLLRKEIAVMRALGCPRGDVVKRAVASALIAGAPAVVAGCLSAAAYAVWSAAATFGNSEVFAMGGRTADAAAGGAVSGVAGVSPLIPAAFIVAAVALLAVVLYIELRIMMRRPIVGQLFNAPGAKAKAGSSSAGDIQGLRRDGAAGIGAAIGEGIGAEIGAVGYNASVAGASDVADTARVVMGAAGAAASSSKAIMIKNNVRFVLRHIIRAKASAALFIVAAIVLIAAPAVLLLLLARIDSDIDRLYEETVVAGEIKPAGEQGAGVRTWRIAGDVISPLAVYGAIDSGMIDNEYMEAAYAWAMVVHGNNGNNGGEAQGSTDNGDEGNEIVDGSDSMAISSTDYREMDILLATNDIGRFISEHSRNSIDDIPGNSRVLADGSDVRDLEIEYADGYDASVFNSNDGTYVTIAGNEGAFIPVILSGPSLDRRGLHIGDTARIACIHVDSAGNPTALQTFAIIIVGTHNRNIVGYISQDVVILPLDALLDMMKMDMGFSKVKFDISQQQVRNIAKAEGALNNIIGANNVRFGSGFAQLDLNIFDDELKSVAMSMEKAMNMLRQLYPIAVACAIVVSCGLAMLFMLRCMRKAAIMRILGRSKPGARAVLLAEQGIISLCGIIVGAIVLAFAGAAAREVSLALCVCCYAVGTIAGAVSGALLVTRRPPLELLQVRE